MSKIGVHFENELNMSLFGKKIKNEQKWAENERNSSLLEKTSDKRYLYHILVKTMKNIIHMQKYEMIRYDVKIEVWVSVLWKRI